MKIGMILDHEFPVDERVEKEAVSLIHAGFEVHLICFRFGKQKKEENYKNIKLHRIYMPRKVYKKLSALILQIPFYNIFWYYHIKRLIGQNNIEILHIHDLPLCGLGVRIKAELGIPFIADLHENYPILIAESHHANTFLGRLLVNKKKWYTKEKEWLVQAKKIIVVADEMKERLQKILNNNIHFAVVPNTIHINHFLSIQQKNEEIEKKFRNQYGILYFGGIDRIRGIETLIKAAELLKNKINNLKIIIIGSGALINSYKAMSKKLCVNHIIQYEGWQNIALLNAYMKNIAVCVIPHLKSSQTDNSSPNKLFIYMLYQKPIIVTNCNSLQKIIKKNNCGLIFESGKANELANRILKLYHNKKLAKQLAENAYKAVTEKYHWEKTGQALIQLYKKLKEEILNKNN